MSNILDPFSLLSSIPDLLPGSKQTLSSSQDGLTALIHAIMSALAFRLVAIDETSTSATFENNVLPENWNKDGPGHYTLRYRHEQSSMEFVVKVLKLGGRTIINAIATESDKANSLDISTNDFLSPSFFPHAIGAAPSQSLVHGFISSHRITDFVSQYQLKILQKLAPSLRKEGYTEEVPAEASSSSANARQPPPAGPHPVPEEPNQPYSLPSRAPPYNPLEIGRRDLDPLPLQNQPHPFRPPSLFPDNGDDGMFVGPNHPIFGDRPRFGDLGTPRRGPWGGDGYLPPMGAPPGARFDPVGPFGSRGPPGRFSTGGPTLPRNFRTGDPDNDEFMPPGASDMYS